MIDKDILHFGETFEDEYNYTVETLCGVEISGTNFFYTSNKEKVTCMECIDILTKPEVTK